MILQPKYLDKPKVQRYWDYDHCTVTLWWEQYSFIHRKDLRTFLAHNGTILSVHKELKILLCDFFFQNRNCVWDKKKRFWIQELDSETVIMCIVIFIFTIHYFEGKLKSNQPIQSKILLFWTYFLEFLCSKKTHPLVNSDQRCWVLQSLHN